MLIKLGLRNVFRNKRRTVLSGLAIGIGMTAMIVSDGFMLGMMKNLVDSVIETFLGEGQIHAIGYKDNFEVDKYIKKSTKLVKSLRQEATLRYVSARTQTFGMISSPYNYVNVMVVGIDSEMESKITKIKRTINQGDLPRKAGDIAIGWKLAAKLEVELGDKIVVTVAQANSEDLAQEQFRVSGIFNFGDNQFDSGTVFVKFSQSQQMLNIGDGSHEVVFTFRDRSEANNTKNPIWKKYTNEEIIAESWQDLAPEIKALLSMVDISVYIISAIVVILAAIIIMNTLFMSFYDRLFEFGVLRSIGTRPGKIIRLILVEAGVLSIVSIFCGFLITFIASGYLAYYGIDYGGIQVGEVTMTEPIYFIFRIKQIMVFPILVFVLSIISAIYPAIYASKITIAKAMDKSL